jgi:hypothetical protein
MLSVAVVVKDPKAVAVQQLRNLRPHLLFREATWLPRGKPESREVPLPILLVKATWQRRLEFACYSAFKLRFRRSGNEHKGCLQTDPFLYYSMTCPHCQLPDGGNANSGWRGPSIHTWPSDQFSSFQMGTMALSRSMA